MAYEVGERVIHALRRRAEQQLGSRFDPRCFHHELLDTGALPLAVLEIKIGQWIRGQRSPIETASNPEREHRP